MYFKISSIFEYSIWLIKKYNEYKSIEKNIYRIIEIRPTDRGEYKIIAQVIGKASIFEFSPKDILNNQIIRGFSINDIHTITFLACHKTQKMQFKILEQNFSIHEQQMIFKIRNNLNPNEKPITKTANEIMLDQTIISNLDESDLKSICYMAGYECAQKTAI
jgi:hypothetical protein